MACFKLWLHPLHRRQAHRPLKINELQRASSHGERIVVLREVCCEASTYVIDVAQLTEVIMHPDALVTRSELAGNPTRLPLRLSQVCEYGIAKSPTQRADGVLGLIAYAHPMAAYTARGQECESSEATQRDVWVLVVTHGAPYAAPPEKTRFVLSQAVNAIIGRGAISGDTRGFEILDERKAKGGFGTVHFFWRKHEASSNAYAGKLLNDGEAMSACLESDALLAVRGHPNIVAFVGAFCFLTASQEHRWMIVTEAHLGGDIRSRVRRCGAFHDSEALQISRDVLSAVAHLHQHHIIHRDVKPANVVLASDGRAVLIDMGLAAHTSDETELKKRCGTPGFTAPEILHHRGCQFKSDVFGCGALLYFAASGKAPFEGSSKKDTMTLNARAYVNFDNRRFLTVAPHTIEIMRDMLERFPARRPSSRSARNAVTVLMDLTSPAELPGQAPHGLVQHLSKPSPSDHASSSIWQSISKRMRALSSLKTNDMMNSVNSFTFNSGAPSMRSTVGGRGPTPDSKARKQDFLAKARALLGHMKLKKRVSAEVTPFVAVTQVA